MLRPISVAQMVEVDRLMVADYGITLLQMMENAGRGLAEMARRLLGGNTAERKAVILIGRGNNGGGGLVAARHLANAGAGVNVALAGEPDQLGEVPEHQRRILVRVGVAGASRPASADELPALLADADLLIDALVGYGLRGPPREPIASFIRAANAVTALRLALDLPSGLDGDEGVPREPCLRADATLTLAWPKAGLLAAAARPFVGALYLADISVPAQVYHAVGVERSTLFAGGPIVRVRILDGAWEPAESQETA
ncbi:MAG: NAD(P)H-hydrate epimerase [Chloroflexi bacterium]|nr:NAD(P)H-hydrate epimerase [Chloroflexota bacterium]